MTEESYHVRLIGPHGPTICVSKDLAMVENYVENDITREVEKDIFIVQVKETVIRQIPAKHL